MDELRKHQEGGDLHHAYLIEGAIESAISGVCEALGMLESDPNLFVRTYETCSIDAVREIKNAAGVRPVSGSRKYLILGFSFAAHEAQNALLKILEEPTPSTHFFVVTPHGHLLLDTVRSRLYAVSVTDEYKEQGDARVFLNTSPRDRLEIVKKIIEEKDRGAALEFVKQLEYALYQKRGVIKESGIALERTLQAQKFLEMRSPSIKLVLEYLALSLPYEASFAR